MLLHLLESTQETIVGDVRAQIRSRLKNAYEASTLVAVKDRIGCESSIATLKRIIDGRDVSVRSWRDVADALGLTLEEDMYEQNRRRLTVHGDDYRWMQANGYDSVADLVAALKTEASK